MQAEIRVASGNRADVLGSLWQLLTRRRDLEGAVTPVHRLPGETDLGGGLEALSVALGSGGAVAALASSLSTWLRGRQARVTIEVSAAGRKVKFSGDRLSPGDVRPILEDLLRGQDVRGEDDED